MDLQERELSHGMQGPDVRLLHGELAHLGYDIPSPEIEERFFGDGTHEAVLAFQRTRGLPPTGVVDSETAAAINGAVEAQRPLPEQLVVNGQVCHADDTPLAGLIVRAFDLALGGEYAQLGEEATTDEEGHYEIVYTAEQFGWPEKQRADLLVRAFSPEEALLAESGIRFRAGDRETVDLVVEPRVELVVEEVVTHQVLIRLLDQETDEPLRGYTVRAYDLGVDEPQDLGFDVTDGRGMCVVVYTTTREEGQEMEEAGIGRRLRLHISSPDDVELHQPEIEVAPGEREVVDVPVPVPQVPEPESPALEELSETLELDAPQELLTYLEEHDICTLDDVRRAGGIRQIEDLPVAADHPALGVLEAHADLSVLSSDLDLNATLIDNGYRSILDISNTSQGSFVTTMGGLIDDPRLALIHLTATAQSRLLTSVQVSLRADAANGYASPLLDRIEPAASTLNDACTCRDCESAVSPLAYLADLLHYTVRHLQDGGQFVSLETLQDTFHQHFRDLPVSCEEMDRQVRQVRICIEVLRRYLEQKGLPAVGSPRETTLQEQQQDYALAAYQALLGKMGASYEDVRLTRKAELDVRQALAERLGIEPDRLDQLPDEPVEITEQKLDELFGLVETGTGRDPLSEGAKLGDRPGGQAQIKRWNLDGVEWNRNTDAEGFVYVRLRDPAAEGVSLYRDAARTAELLASGQDQSPNGVALPILTPENDSGLSGSLQFAYPAVDSDAVAISAVPRFLSWRLQHLRTLWAQQDWPDDRPGEGRPLIDPDVIGPDDFRTPLPKASPRDDDRPFDIWLRRREWVDAQLEALSELDELSRMFTYMNRAIRYPLGTRTRRGTAGWPANAHTEFDEYSKTLSRGSDADVEEVTQELQQLGLTVESFNRLVALQKKDERAKKDARNEKVKPEEWQEVRSILVQARKVLLFPRWRQDEVDAGIQLGPREFWSSLRNPQEGEWPPPLSDNIPMIDPDEVTPKDLAEPTVGKRAIALWHARRERLEEIPEEIQTEREALEGQGADSFDGVLRRAIGHPDPGDALPCDLNGVKTDLEGNDPQVADNAKSIIKNDLHMTEEDFLRLMAIKAKYAPRAPAEQGPTEQEWAEVYDILAGAQKRKREYPDWIGEEQGMEYWQALKARLPLWRAGAQARQEWRQALRVRSRPPLIDPDLLAYDSTGERSNFRSSADGRVARDIWEGRAQWVVDRIWELRNTRTRMADFLEGLDEIVVGSLFAAAESIVRARLAGERRTRGLEHVLTQVLGGPLPDLDTGLNESRRTITEMLFLPVSGYELLRDVKNRDAAGQRITPQEWSAAYRTLARAALVARVVSLVEEREQGNDIAPRLEQLGLTPAAFSYLIRMRKLVASAAPGNDPLLAEEWENVYSILAQVQKRRQFAVWRDRERAEGLTLGPDYFQIPERGLAQFPPQQMTPPQAWRASKLEYMDWEDSLQARIDQQQAAIDGFHAAVSEVEEGLLTTLRDALIAASDAKGADPAQKAKWLTDRLLIDAQADGCQVTTRVSQAIETIQNLLWSVRTGQLYDTYRGLELDAEDFDEEWQWMGSYPTWRAAVFVFLYPENILIPSLRRRQTPAFRQLVESVRSNRRLTPERACEEARRYSDYFRDVCSLTVEASCHAETRIYEGDCRDRREVDERTLFYTFARGGHTNTVYWSAYDPKEEATGYAQSFWAPVPELKNVTKVIGAHPYHMSDDKRHIYLFACTRDEGVEKLVFIRCDLETQNWESELVDLDLPDDVVEFDAVMAQRMDSDGRPRLAIRDKETGYTYSRCLNPDGSGWEDEGFALLFGPPGHVRVLYIPKYTADSDPFLCSAVKRLLALHQLTDKHIVLIVESRKTTQGTGMTEGRIFAASFDLQYGHWITTVVENGERKTKDEEKWGWARRVAPEDILTYQAFLWHELGQPPTAKEWVGSFQWPDTKAIYALWSIGSVVHYESVCGLGFTVGGQFAVGWQTLAPDSGPAPDYHERLIAYQRSDALGHGPYRALFTRSLMLRLNTKSDSRTRLSPQVSDPFSIVENLSQSELQHRRGRIQQAFGDNRGEPQSNLTYLEEAYYFVPVFLALELQKQGHYVPALDWFRTVYDYTVPDTPHAVDKRKISYVLERESLPLPPNYKRATDWLLDPLDPHSIAAARLRNTYTRFTLLSIIRCLLAYADAEFTRDTVESLARARTLYMTALELLGTGALKQTFYGCEEKIGNLLIDIQGEYLVPDELKPELYELERDLYRINDTGTLRALEGRIREVMARDDAPLKDRIDQSRDLAKKTLSQKTAPPTLELVLSTAGKRMAAAHSVLLGNKIVFGAARDLGASMAQDAPDGVAGGYSPAPTYPPLRAVPAASPSFCISPNPVSWAYRLKAELNLHKLRTCRNIAGMKRQVEPYAAPTDQVSGLPQIGPGGKLLLPGTTIFRPTQYRYAALVERAKQLVNVAQQMESAMLATIERRDAEAYSELKARQDVQSTRAQVQLATLRVQEAESNMDLAELQQQRAEIEAKYYQGLLDEGDLAEEQASLAMMLAASAAYITSLQGAQAISTEASILSTLASYERRRQEWVLRKSIADQDILIGAQQVRIAQDHVRVVGQERNIVRLQAGHAKDTVEFLATKFTNVELYDWMSDVLEGVYSFFLQEATSVAKLAEHQLAFERQETPPRYIQDDYWEAPSEEMAIGAPGAGKAPDRRGLTGSARLLQDIYQLDQYAFETDRRKLQLSKTVSLVSLGPADFQRFRENGVLTFGTPMEMFDRDFPGHYLRLIKRVRTTVVALISPTQGIHATLSTTAASRVVIGGDIFQTVVVRRDPELVALTSPKDASGVFDLQQQPEKLLPFEGLGVDTTWEFRMPRAANQFDYSTIADVLLTIDYTALNSYNYRQQVIQSLRPTLSLDRPFSFRHELSDAWYDLHNPEQSKTPMVVKFKTRREDYAPNLERLKIQQVVLYFARKTGETFEVPVTYLRITEEGTGAQVGGSATSIDGIISTRRGNAGSWTAMIGLTPFGEWELALPDTAEMRKRFKEEKIENMLFVITYSGRTAEWPE